MNLGDGRPILLALLGVVGFILLIVCANLANLALARGVSRQPEMAVRRALGAGRVTLVRQLLTELILLGFGGGVLGLLIGFWGIGRLAALVPVNVPYWVIFEIDGRMLAFALTASLLTILLAGLFPALHGSRATLFNSLKAGGSQFSGRLERRRFRGLLVVSEVALSTVLLIGAGLMIRNLLELSSVDPGFEQQNALTVGMDLLAHLDKPADIRTQIFERFQERLASLPGILRVGAIDRLPLKGADLTKADLCNRSWTA